MVQLRVPRGCSSNRSVSAQPFGARGTPNELNIHAGEDGSVEEIIALYKAVMDKLAENGGVVPDSLRN